MNYKKLEGLLKKKNKTKQNTIENQFLALAAHPIHFQKQTTDANPGKNP